MIGAYRHFFTVESLSYSPISLVDIGHLLINAFVIIAAVAERFSAVSTVVCVWSFGRSYIFLWFSGYRRPTQWLGMQHSPLKEGGFSEPRIYYLYISLPM